MPDQLNVQGVTWFQRDLGGGTLNITPEQERWEPGDVVRAHDGGLWCRAEQHDIDAGWPWGYCPSYVPGVVANDVPEGSVEESRPVRPLHLVFRNGQLCSGITDEQGLPVPAWVVKVSMEAMQSQMTELATDMGELRKILGGVLALHRPAADGSDPDFCGECAHSYPCHTARLVPARFGSVATKGNSRV